MGNITLLVKELPGRGGCGGAGGGREREKINDGSPRIVNPRCVPPPLFTSSVDKSWLAMSMNMSLEYRRPVAGVLRALRLSRPSTKSDKE